MAVSGKRDHHAYDDLLRRWLIAFDRGLLARGVSHSMDRLWSDLDAAMVRGHIALIQPPPVLIKRYRGGGDG